MDSLKEDLDGKHDIIQNFDILQKNIKSNHLDVHKEMKTDETQTLIPRVKTFVSNITLWPLKKYKLNNKIT